MRRWNWRFIGVAGACLLAICISPISARAEAPVRIGLLTCQVDGSVGKILGSFRRLSCTFERAAAHPLEFYQGEITRIGLDIGRTQYSDIAWGVFALSRPYATGALAGTYAGLSGQVSVGIGLGANALVGGLSRSFALQPVSIEASRGLNLALGVAKLVLFSTPGYAEPPAAVENAPPPPPPADPADPQGVDQPRVIQGVTE